MQKYSEYSPTAFDPKGLNLEERQDWLVAPVMQTRDSRALELSNFRFILADLGGESDNVEVHRFNHWGPGWFEIIIVKPDTPEAEKAAQWEAKLEDYPVADEMDFSELEYELASGYWKTMSIREKGEYIERAGGLENGVSIFSIRHYIPSCRQYSIESLMEV